MKNKLKVLKRLWNVAVFFLLASTLLVLLERQKPPPSTDAIQRSISERRGGDPSANATKAWKKILIWTDFFQTREGWLTLFRRLSSGQCEESRCSVSLDRAQIGSAEAVLFHAFNLQDRSKSHKLLKKHIHGLPQGPRDPNQIYVFYSEDPPPRLLQPDFLRHFRNYFNWTMTYRKDSDVVEPFGIIKKRKVQRPESEIKYVTQEQLDKKKMAVWIASFCPRPVPLKRELFIKELSKYIKVDIIGKCGEMVDDRKGFSIFGETIGESNSEKEINNYRFYLALENSLCKDYVTEKVFKGWKMGIIPVVWGAVNYSAFAPPKSFINYDDFESISQLANYLKKVGEDASLYNEYLRWNRDYDVEIGSPYSPMICDLCKKLHEHSPSSPRRWYPDIQEWFVNQSDCQNNKGNVLWPILRKKDLKYRKISK